MSKRHYLTGLATAAVAALALAAPGAQAAPVTAINFANNAGQDLFFRPGGTFMFGDDTATVNDLQFTSQTGGTGTLAGLQGEIVGSFQFAVPTNGSAPVTTTGGRLLLSDGAGNIVTAGLDLTLIGEGAPGFEDTGAIRGTADFTGSTYNGSNPDLLTLVGQGPNAAGPAVITFQTVDIPVIDLAEVYTNGGHFSYSGSIGTPFTEGEVPEPATLGLIGAGLLGLGMVGRRRKAAA